MKLATVILLVAASGCAESNAPPAPRAVASTSEVASFFDQCGPCPSSYVSTPICSFMCGSECPHGRYGSTPNASQCERRPQE